MEKPVSMRLGDFREAWDQVKHPSKVALAVTIDSENRHNLITLEWFMRTSIIPPMIAISVAQTRYSYQCLQENRFFNLVLPSKEMRDVAVFCGKTSGQSTDKFVATGVDYFSGRLRKLPIIRNAAAVFECEVVSQIRSGDHTIFVGEVHYSWYRPDKEVLLASDLF